MYLFSIYSFLAQSDLKAKARRWDEKQVEGMKKKRDSYLAELKDLSKHRRKEPELQNLRSQIDGLEHRLRYSTKDKETTVSQFQFTVISHAHCYSCLCPYLLLFQAPLNTLSNFLCCGSYLVI